MKLNRMFDKMFDGETCIPTLFILILWIVLAIPRAVIIILMIMLIPPCIADKKICQALYQFVEFDYAV